MLPQRGRAHICTHTRLPPDRGLFTGPALCNVRVCAARCVYACCTDGKQSPSGTEPALSHSPPTGFIWDEPQGPGGCRLGGRDSADSPRFQHTCWYERDSHTHTHHPHMFRVGSAIAEVMARLFSTNEDQMWARWRQQEAVWRTAR